MSLPSGILERSLLAFPFVWLIGLSAFYIQTVAIVIALSGCIKHYRFHWALIPLLLYIFVYCLSVLLNFQTSGLDRIIGSVYNLSYWVSGVLIAQYALQNGCNYKVDFNERFSGILLSVVFALMVVLKLVGAAPITLPTLASFLVNPDSVPELIGDTLRLPLLNQEWYFGEMSTRFSILSPYANACASAIYLLFIFATRNESKVSLSFIVLLVMAFSVVYSTNSRSVIAIFSVYLLYVGFLKVSRGIGLVPVIALSLCLVCSVVLVFGHVLLDFAEGVFQSRAGSNSLRFQSYIQAINLTIGTNPVLGIGVKPNDGLGIPLGSHSTLIGVFVKTGLIGVLCISAYFVALAALWLRARGCSFAERKFVMGIMVFSLYFIFEDIDAPQFTCFLYFLGLGEVMRICLRPASMHPDARGEMVSLKY